MAKIESTVVNALIARPKAPEPAVDLFAEAIPVLPRVRAARGTAPARLAEIPALPSLRARPAIAEPPPKLAEIYNATARVKMIAPRNALWYAVPLVIVVSIATSLIMRSQLAGRAPIAAPPPRIAPAAALVVVPVAPVVTTPPVIDVRFDSEPAGATVTLIENGRPRFLGTTPVVAGIDSSREAEVVFTGDGRDTQLAHFDPRTTQRVSAPALVVAPPAHPAKHARSVRRSHR